MPAPPAPLLFELFAGEGNTFAIDFTDEIAKLVAGTAITGSTATAVNHDTGTDATSALISGNSFTTTEGRFGILTTVPLGVYDVTVTVTLDAGGPLVECATVWVRACPTP